MRAIPGLVAALQLIAALLAGCTDADIFRLVDPPPLPQDKITLEGTYCASNPESLVFPVKILFVLDDSGSMAESDPAFRRLVAARELVASLLAEPEVYFGVERFQDGEPFLLTADPVFTRDALELDRALADAQHQPAGWTPYIGALSTAITAIKSDMNADPLMAARTRYVVIFLSDGEPTDERTPPYPQIKDRVNQLKQLEEGSPAAGEVTLHTAYLESNGDDSGGAHVVLLEEMAQMTGGQFRDFENGDAIDFTGYDVTAISRDYRAYFPILVSNLSARATLGGYLVDSDADGLPDQEEISLGTDPARVDTDGDGCGDMMEAKYAGWDPLVPGWETSPVHCDCKEDERRDDTDGDGLTDCEEKWFSLDRKAPDSDIDFEGNPAPDHMLDRLEVMWHLGRTKWDAGEDYDVDGASNLEELATHMDPNSNDNEFRDELAYRYEYVNQQTGNQNCYDFRVSNVRVVNTIAAEGRQAGDNLVVLYFIEAPQDNPFLESIVRVFVARVRFDGEAPEPALVTVKPDDFRIMGEEGAGGEEPLCEEGNCLPVAVAGEDRTEPDDDGDGEAHVLLDASASWDSDGSVVGFLWLENGESIATARTADVVLPVGRHEIELVVMDDDDATATDELVVTVVAGSSQQSLEEEATGGEEPRTGCSTSGAPEHGPSPPWWLLLAPAFLIRRRRLWVALFLAGWLAASACGTPPEMELSQHGRPIINGSLDTSTDHAAVVAITFGGYMCSGTLISQDVILTAGHCAQGYGPSSFTVFFGSSLGSAESRDVSEVRVHSAYNPNTITNDIAMLRLASPPPQHVQPIPYLPHSLGIGSGDVGEPLEYVGFGETETRTSGVKLAVTNDLDWICTQPGGCVVGSGYTASQNTICGDQTPGGPCHGDSGGPAFVHRSGQEYVAGITSYGDQYCQVFGCSTKVDEFEPFISDFVGGALGTPCSTGSMCLSGQCVDGVCCEAVCAGICEACNVPGSLGVCAPAPNGTPCPDGDPCNGEEVCLLQECVGGEPPGCDDANPCTRDRCESPVGCVHEPEGTGASCSDGDACNGHESCQDGVCQPGTALDCQDRNPCTQDSCDPATGCHHDPVQDGMPCGGGLCGVAVCAAGTCVAEDPVACEDSDPCTEDWCDPASGCVHHPYPDGYQCGGCRMCIDATCVEDQDCVIEGGCATASLPPASSPVGWILLLAGLALVKRPRRRSGL